MLMTHNLPIGISGRPSLRLPMLSQGLRALQHFVPHALVVEALGEGIQIGTFRLQPYRLNIRSLENAAKVLCK